MNFLNALQTLYLVLQLTCLLASGQNSVIVDGEFNCVNLPPGTYSTLEDIVNFLNANEPDWRAISAFSCLYTDLDLAGSIPPSFYQLPQLVNLDLWGHGLTGTIGSEIRLLTELKSLYLATNSFEGTIPTEIGHLSHLTSLTLSHNNFEGTLPSELFSLGAAWIIDVADNHLTGTLGYELNSLVSLERGYFSNNGFNGTLPVDLFEAMPQLNLINVRDTGLSGLMPNSSHGVETRPPVGTEVINIISCSGLGQNAKTFAEALEFNQAARNRLKRAYWIFCANAGLTGTLPSSLGDIEPLSALHLYQNALTGTIPETFGNLKNLVNLHLSDNELRGPIPEEIGRLSSLKEFNAENNKLSGSLPEEIGRLSNLLDLNVRENQLSGSIPRELEGLAKLQTLDLRDNDFSGRFPNIFSDMKDLSLVYVGGNSFRGWMPEFSGSGDIESGQFFLLYGSSLKEAGFYSIIAFGVIAIAVSICAVLVYKRWNEKNQFAEYKINEKNSEGKVEEK